MSFDVETIDSAAMPNDEIRAVAEWLIDGARSAPQPQQVLTQLCERLGLLRSITNGINRPSLVRLQGIDSESPLEPGP